MDADRQPARKRGRALVTGVAGFIGSHLAERLTSEGSAVIGVDRFSDYYDERRKRTNLVRLADRPNFELVEGDLTELDSADLLDGVDVVFHLAAQPGVRTSWGTSFEVYLRDNVLATQRLLEAAKHASLERFVFASSSSIYGKAETFPTPETAAPRPISPYGVTKLAAEHLGFLYESAFGIPVVGLRYFTVFGPRQRPDMAFSRFIEACISGAEVPVYGDGGQVRDFTYIDDIVEGTLAASRAGRPGAVYNLAGGSQVSVLEAIATIAEAVGRPVEVEHKPPSAGDAPRTGGDTTAARKDLDYRPSVSFQEGVQRQVEARTALSAGS